jgi:hypothetical protein
MLSTITFPLAAFTQEGYIFECVEQMVFFVLGRRLSIIWEAWGMITKDDA